jgi:hypothetical protein
LTEIRNEQIIANRQLFDALAVVGAAKAKIAAKQDALRKLQNDLAAAESNADAAANTAAKAKAERERAADRLAVTNRALKDAQDALNLALLE